MLQKKQPFLPRWQQENRCISSKNTRQAVSTKAEGQVALHVIIPKEGHLPLESMVFLLLPTLVCQGTTSSGSDFTGCSRGWRRTKDAPRMEAATSEEAAGHEKAAAQEEGIATHRIGVTFESILALSHQLAGEQPKKGVSEHACEGPGTPTVGLPSTEEEPTMEEEHVAAEALEVLKSISSIKSQLKLGSHLGVQP